MKKAIVGLFVLAIAFPLAAQDAALNSMSLNGATGLYVVPTGRIAYPNADMGLNGGYHTNFFKPFDDGKTEANHLLQINFSFLRMIELSGTFDIQPDGAPMGEDPNDFMIGAKFQLPFGGMPIAIGANYQSHNYSDDLYDYTAFQIYVAVTYRSEFFGWPADTTLVVGHTFMEDKSHSNIDFGMGFDLILFPTVTGNFIHFLLDFANFGYSNGPWGAGAWTRGVLNTGLRFDLSQIPALERFTFAVDVFLADAFDSAKDGGGRSFGIGICFGSRL